MQKTIRVNLFLSVALLAIMWLGPIVSLGTRGQDVSLPIEIHRPADRYYSTLDHRCYTLVYADSISVTNSTGHPVTLSPGESDETDISPGETIIRAMLPGADRLTARDATGHKAGLDIVVLADSPPPLPVTHTWATEPLTPAMLIVLPPQVPLTVSPTTALSTTVSLTRTAAISLSDDMATVTYTVRARRPGGPEGDSLLRTMTADPALLIKRVFYSYWPTPTLDVRCQGWIADSFTGAEFSAISPPAVHMSSEASQVTIVTQIAGWRYSAGVWRHLLNVMPTRDTFTCVSLRHAQIEVPTFALTPTLRDDGSLVWEDPRTPIYERTSAQPVSRVVTGIQALFLDFDQGLETAAAADLALSALAALFLPLALPWGLHRLCSRQKDTRLITARARSRVFWYTAALLWLGPLGAFGLARLVSGSQAYGDVALWSAAWTGGLAVIWMTFPVALPGLATRMRLEEIQRKVPRWAGMSLLVIGLAVLSQVFLASAEALWRSRIIFPLGGLVMALTSWSLARTATVDRGGRAVPPIVWIVGAIVVALLTVPIPGTIYAFTETAGWPSEVGRSLFLLWQICVMPYLGLWVLFSILRSLDADHPAATVLVHILFVFVVGFTGVFPQSRGGVDLSPLPYVFSPVPFALAWLLFPLLVVPAIPVKVRNYVLKERKDLLALAMASTGPARDVALSLAPRSRDWDNGRLGGMYGLVVGGVIALCITALVPGTVDQFNTPFLLLMTLLGIVLPMLFRWVLAGFVLGYFFPRLAGRNGAVKGLALAGAMACIALGYDLVFRVRSAVDLQAFLFTDVVLTVLGLAGMGVALDYYTLRKAGYQWKQLLTVYHMPFLVGYVSSALTTLSATAMGLINGQIVSLFTALVDAILHTR